ncbi:hypothetical protein PX699_00405 [Sphingobium sp. H39-3-25]|uniref:head-tail connector protein n=1 Tax=Sphingobium arseniciresistens TaxID=3030834 RepID=UPI0023B9C872|nr:hypothetical protein [Sphingobium arseniciresistens]
MLFQLSPVIEDGGYADAILSLAAVKAHLRIDDDGEDDLVIALRDASIDLVQKCASLRLAPTPGLVARFAGFGAGMMVGVGPAATLAVTAISYLDPTGASVALAPGGWRVGADGGLLPAIGTAWPVAGGEVTVTFTVGYPAGACPKGLLSAVKLMAGHLYANRDAMLATGFEDDLPAPVVNICNLYRPGVF